MASTEHQLLALGKTRKQYIRAIFKERHVFFDCHNEVSCSKNDMYVIFRRLENTKQVKDFFHTQARKSCHNPVPGSWIQIPSGDQIFPSFYNKKLSS